MDKKTSTKKGFTIVEFSLASVFIGTLLITIALIISYVIAIYQKGLSVKAVNEVGESLVEDFKRSISASSACKNSSSCPSNSKTISGKVQINGNNVDNVPVGGVFCSGKYSYIWNSGYALDGKANGITVTYRGYSNKNFRLARAYDPDRTICKNFGDNSHTVELPSVKVTELIGNSEDNLALYDLQVKQVDYYGNTGHAFYSGTFILGTVNGGPDIMSNGNYCTEPPDKLNTDFAYCAINKFNFAARATGREIQ